MKTRFSRIGGAAVLVSLVGTAWGGECTERSSCAAHAVPDALVHPDELAQREIARRLLPLMPKEHRDAIVAAGGIGSEGMSVSAADAPASGETPRAFMERVISDELASRMTETQWQIVHGIVATLERGERPPALCFHPDTDPEYAYAINELIEFPLSLRFQQTSRWSRTATDGSGLSQGDPTTITYSFVPDGTFVPNLIGVSGNSNLHAWLNGIYGSPANWQPLFEQVFDRWSELIAVNYVYEPNDDGVRLNDNQGVLGVRGDVRIAAITIDGNSGTLAYNNFPNDGDMVFDSADNFFNNTGNNSLRFRNVAAHEHGHGLGMLHVCPVQQTKLMEPFVSVAFNGPQLDDILNGHRHYGDPMEPDTDSPATAPLLGVFGVGSFDSVTNVSIDGSGDQDYYRVSVTEPTQIEVTVTPDAGAYLQGGQTSQCNNGTHTDYNAVRDLRIDLYDAANPNSPIASVNQTGVGGSELLEFPITQPGDYLVRVSATGANNVQRYAMALFFVDLPFLDPLITTDAPSRVDPGVPTNFEVTIDPREDELVGTPRIHYRLDDAQPFQSAPLTQTGPNTYTASLPAAQCSDEVQFYISAVGDTAGEVTLPEAGAAGPFEAIVGDTAVVFADNFSTDLGWTVGGPQDNATSGIWTRVVPIGTFNGGTPVQPGSAAVGNMCFITGQHPGGSNIGASDVDNGRTTLTSPVLDLTGYQSPVTISYYRWFSNSQGAEPDQDVFVVEVSNNGGATWHTVEIVGPTGPGSDGGWFQHSFDVESIVPLTDAVRVRFIASDYDPQSLVEAGVDGFQVEARVCEDANFGCSAADLVEPFGSIDVFDLLAYIDLYSASDPGADFAAPFGVVDIFDLLDFVNHYSNGCP